MKSQTEMTFMCENCEGRGWIGNALAVSDWAYACDVCSGIGSFSLGSLARTLDEDPGVIERLSELRSRKATAKRLFDKLVKLLPANSNTERQLTL